MSDEDDLFTRLLCVPGIPLVSTPLPPNPFYKAMEKDVRHVTLISVDCEAPYGVGSPAVGDMTEFGAVDVEALRDGRIETFHGVGCSEETFTRFAEWLAPRMPVVFVSDNPAYDFQWINYYFWKHHGRNPFGHSARRIGDFYAGAVGHWEWASRWKKLRRTPHTHQPVEDAMGNAEALLRILDGER